MKKTILSVNGSEKLTKETLKSINGGVRIPTRCGGDGSFIYQDGIKVCCYQPSTGYYIC
ncbi:hypothetical protein [Tenacibaculum sediminilitoris]|uniref:hypothetical protein n=1 Tax=Tenacibaculum sediminilitoris TaxID=1820334 RepID=UPI0038B50821